VKPVDFDLHRPSTLAETLELLNSFGDEAKVLAGGQSLVPLLNFRLARPAHVIDIGLLGALDGVRADGPVVTIGAMTRQAQAERSPVVAARCPLLAAALPWIAYPPIRVRGTIGGSLAHADPAAELPAVAVALGATLIAARSVQGHAPGRAAGSTGAASTRAVSAAQFYQGYLTTALAPEELLTEIRFPAAAPHTGAAFAEVARRRGDFALVGCAAQVTLSGGLIADARIGLSGVAGVPVRGAAAEERLRRRPLDDALLARAADDVAAGLSPPTDLHGSGEYRRHLAAVLIRRTVTQAHQRARAQPFLGSPR
jgi:carbon-monoxide dehydrogenase medium subunit